VTRPHRLLAVLGTLALGAGSLATHAGAQPNRAPASGAAAGTAATIVLHRHLRRSGVYAVRVGVIAPPGPGAVVIGVRIGMHRRAATASAPHRRVWVAAEVTIRHGDLTIAASGPRGLGPLAVRIVRLRGLASTPAGARTPHTLTASGTSGATGQTGPAGPLPAVAATASVSTAAPAPAPADGSTGATGTTVTTGTTGPSGPPGDPQSWHQIFDDEFNGSALDTTKWSTGWYGSGITAPVQAEEAECYDPSQVVVAGGELDLNLISASETCGGQTRPYASGMITTNGKFNFTYGYVEARAWVPGGASISDWPAIWTDGQIWPTDGEMDVFEGLGGLACWHFHDPLGGPGGCSTQTFTGGWHTFAADWEPGSVTYYYDGLAVGTVSSGITASPMYLIINLAADGTYGGPIQAPATLRVDYVRVWQH